MPSQPGPWIRPGSGSSGNTSGSRRKPRSLMPSLKNSTGIVCIARPLTPTYGDRMDGIHRKDFTPCESRPIQSSWSTRLAGGGGRLGAARAAFHRAQLRQHLLTDQLDALVPVVEAEAEVVGHVLEAGLVVLDRLLDDVVRATGDDGAFQVVRAVPAARRRGDPAGLGGPGQDALPVDLGERLLAGLAGAGDRDDGPGRHRLAVLLGELLHPLDPLDEGPEGDTAGHPAVAVLDGAADRGRRVAAVPDRDAVRRGRRRVNVDVVEFVELALEAD